MQTIKFNVIHRNGNISPFAKDYNDSIENIINSWKVKKNWIGGKFEGIFIDVHVPKFKRTEISCEEYNHLLLNASITSLK